MDKRAILKKVKEVYSQNQNMMLYLNENTHRNSVEDIMISYDFQAGEIAADFLAGGESSRRVANKISELLVVSNELGIVFEGNVLEAGVGDGTFLTQLINETNIKEGYGFDISWSRVIAGMNYSKQMGLDNLHLFQADLFNIPLADNSMDIVYTVEAVQLNTDREKEILEELYRVSGEYLILLEASYDLGTEVAKKHMEEHGYSKRIYSSVKELGYDVLYYDLLSEKCCPESDPEALLIIKKNKKTELSQGQSVWRDPVTGAELSEYNDSFWSRPSMLAYPKIKGIPVLLESNAVVATKYEKY